jgi:hypothetical protein
MSLIWKSTEKDESCEHCGYGTSFYALYFDDENNSYYIDDVSTGCLSYDGTTTTLWRSENIKDLLVEYACETYEDNESSILHQINETHCLEDLIICIVQHIKEKKAE